MKWVIFDAYGTLFDAGKYNIKKIAEEIANKYSIDSQTIFKMWTSKYIEIENDTKQSFQTIAMTTRESLAYVFDILGIGSDYEHYVYRMNEEWSNPALMPGARELLNWLKGQECHVGIISNSDDDTLQAAIKKNELSIDSIISSEMAKSYKPEPQIFEYAMKKWGCVPEQCIYIGNSYNDVKASSFAGIKCIHIQNKGIIPGDAPEGNDYYTVNGLLESKKYIEVFLEEKI